MNKIKTIFKRNWDGNRGVIDKYISDVTPEILKYDSGIVATEKVDGTNIRLTVRNKQVVRIEKKTLIQNYFIHQHKEDVKAIAILIMAGLLAIVPPYLWFVKNIQGNPLNIDHTVFKSVVKLPHNLYELKEWLPKQKSQVGMVILILCGIAQKE